MRKKIKASCSTCNILSSTPRKILSRVGLFFAVNLIGLSAQAEILENSSTSQTINIAELISRQVSHWPHYSHYKVIGICTWMHWGLFPVVLVKPELDEYKPDLVVTVYNQPGDDPWFEARETIDPLSSDFSTHVIKNITGFSMTTGNNAELSGQGQMHYNALRAKIVDVIGDPMVSLSMPMADLRPDTTAFRPYYQSQVDVLGTLGIAEAIQPDTYNPLTHYIGSSVFDHWSYEYPRSMTIDVDNDYKAAVVAALHAADIVTNTNPLHIVHSTENRCGVNCAVANVIEETSDTNEVWQEVYPKNAPVLLGKSDALTSDSTGSSDDVAGNGNYVFVIWRHYRGCVQADGELLFASSTVSPTIKR